MGTEFRCPDILKPPNSTKQNPALHWIKPNIITQLWHKDKDTSPHFMVSSWSVSNGQKLWEFSDSLNGNPCQHVSHVVSVCNWQCHRKCSLSTSTCASICCSVWDEKCVYRRKDTFLFWYICLVPSSNDQCVEIYLSPQQLVKRKIKIPDYFYTFAFLYFSFSDVQLVSVLSFLSSVTGQA